MDDIARTGMSPWGDYIVEYRGSTGMIAYKKNEPIVIHDIDPESNPLPVESANRLKYYRVVRELVSTTQLSCPHSPESTHSSSTSSSSSTPSSCSSPPLTTPYHSLSPSSISEDEDRYQNADDIPVTPYHTDALDALDLATPHTPLQLLHLRTHARPSGKRKKKQNERHGPNLMQIWDESWNKFINRKKPTLPRCLYGSRRKLDQRGDDRLSGVCWFHRLNVGRGREDCQRERGRRMG